MVINKVIKQNTIQRRHEFQNTYVYKSDKIVVSARIMSSSIRWRYCHIGIVFSAGANFGLEVAVLPEAEVIIER